MASAAVRADLEKHIRRPARMRAFCAEHGLLVCVGRRNIADGLRARTSGEHHGLQVCISRRNIVDGLRARASGENHGLQIVHRLGETSPTASAHVPPVNVMARGGASATGTSLTASAFVATVNMMACRLYTASRSIADGFPKVPVINMSSRTGHAGSW